ncbi:ferredoxin--NADP reductase [Nocardia macrotermitis]|uniref:3-ketosteroid-9-alpha-monooxygenase, ferredoxin reductase component n=1 Tax=Nocardia macrotermitis TaxID=2585198 RepID=A0A7K0CZ26_9NOCA|nr:ferredoxin--NADP reductase [Nocardia macrotermitis]MQY18680.1 3-ketosteroid-9-alpha-monooxygenase, ferredoxin reductase component [Nocardia macrotermitis]
MARPPMFQRATVTRISKESADARTFVLAPHEGPITYRAGQFCTFRVEVDGRTLFRSYSMSSAPETDGELMTTVKRVPGGAVSNWLHDNLVEGDEVEMSQAAGRFCLRDTQVPLLGFSGGSGITPVLSLTKSALATTARRVRLLCADRDPESVIFDTALTELAAKYPGRLSVIRHLDSASGFLTPEAIAEFVGFDGAADSYICGPEPFMEMIEKALPGPGLIFSERFGAPVPVLPETPTAETPAVTPSIPETPTAPAKPAGEGSVTIILNRKKKTVPRKDGETLLESARRAGLTPPFSCESGNCATCMAKVLKGHATLRQNNALTDDELDEGYVLTCQAIPDTDSITVDYE